MLQLVTFYSYFYYVLSQEPKTAKKLVNLTLLQYKVMKMCFHMTL